MIAKVGTSTDIASTLEYNENALKGGEVVFSNGIDPNMPVSLQARLLESYHNPKYKVKAHTIIISHGDNDSKKLTPKQEKEYLRAFVDGMIERGFDLDNSRWVIARHGNTDNIHYHMAVMTTKEDGTRFKDYYLGKNASRVAAEVSKKFELEHAEWSVTNETTHRKHHPRPPKKKRILPISGEARDINKKFINRKAAIEEARRKKQDESQKTQTRQKPDRQTNLSARHQRDTGGETTAQRKSFRR